jgi:hypothetical protein
MMKMSTAYTDIYGHFDKWGVLDRFNYFHCFEEEVNKLINSSEAVNCAV